MLSINELSGSIQALEESLYSQNRGGMDKNLSSSVNVSQSSSRQLLRKCKQIIQQQMLQLNHLSAQNQNLSDGVKQIQSQLNDSIEHTHQLSAQIIQLKSSNETLQKQINKLTQQIQNINHQKDQQQTIINLSHNKNETLESFVRKLQQQNQSYKQKCHLLQSTIELLTLENQKLSHLACAKDEEMRNELQKLKQFKFILEKNNHFQQVDLQMTMKLPEHNLCTYPTEDLSYENPFKTIAFNRYPDSKSQKTSKETASTHYKTIEKTHPKSHLNKSMTAISPFSIVDEKPSISRIRKNVSKPKQEHEPKTLINQTNHFTMIKAPTRGKTVIEQKSKQKGTNPEINEQLSSIKKQILKQYNMMSLKKQMMNQGMINKTLKEIESKLHKMTKLSSIDPSESQFQ